MEIWNAAPILYTNTEQNITYFLQALVLLNYNTCAWKNIRNGNNRRVSTIETQNYNSLCSK